MLLYKLVIILEFSVVDYFRDTLAIYDYSCMVKSEKKEEVTELSKISLKFVIYLEIFGLVY